MSALYILIPVSIGMGLIGLCAFFWALRSKQFDDPDGSAWRVIAPKDYPRHTSQETEGMPDDKLAPHPEDRSAPGGV